MARKEPDPPLDHDPLAGGLKHNPFKALKKIAGAAPESEAAASAPREPLESRSRAENPAPKPDRPRSIASSSASSVPAEERVVVRRERKGRGGKSVTSAEGPGLARFDLEELARDAARALGTGARVENAALIVQGEQTERLIAWLATRGLTSVVRGN